MLDFIRGSHVRGAGWDEMFQPKDSMMQVMLSFYLWFRIEPKDIREPVDARWKAFRARYKPGTSVPATKAEPSRGPAVVYGAWSTKLTPWQAAQFIVPMAGIVAVLVDATGVWR